MKRAIIALTAMLMIGGFSGADQAIALSISDQFSRTGQEESFVTFLTVFGGATTSQRWSDLIEVIASGTGVRDPSTGNIIDPFFEFDPDAPAVPTTVNTTLGLRLSFTGCATVVECPAPSILDFIVFSEGIGFVTPPSGYQPEAVMSYSPEHRYHFIIDVGRTDHLLTIGNSDGGVFDNAGQFDIQLLGVQPRVSAVPEAGSLVLLASGLVGLLGVVLRQQAQRGNLKIYSPPW